MSYTRNFEFRVAPQGGQRAGRFSAESEIVIGAPVIVADGAEVDDLGLIPADLAAADANVKPGLCGVAVYEYKGQEGWAGDDPYLTTYADKDTVPSGAAFQIVSGHGVKVCLRNTTARTFLNTRDYAGRTMVAGLGATPTLQVGDFLTPGAGNDSAGYWKETSTDSDKWLVVTKVDNTRGEVEAVFLF